MPVVPGSPLSNVGGSGLLYSDLSAPAAATIPFGQWFLVVPEQPSLSVPLIRTASTSSTSLPGGGNSSFTRNRTLEESAVHPFGDGSDPGKPVLAVISHGAVEGEELDLDFLFLGESGPPTFLSGWYWPTYEQWEEVTRHPDLTMLLQSDMASQWYVDLGGSYTGTVLSASDRKTRPIYIVTIHAIQQPAP